MSRESDFETSTNEILAHYAKVGPPRMRKFAQAHLDRVAQKDAGEAVDAPLDRQADESPGTTP